jgi:hypothetical protein
MNNEEDRYSKWEKYQDMYINRANGEATKGAIPYIATIFLGVPIIISIVIYVLGIFLTKIFI